MANLCSITDCPTESYCKTYCIKHYYRAKRGQSLTGKSRFDRRPCRIEGSGAYIELANGKGETIVDSDNSNLDTHNWCLSGDGYPMTYVKGKLVKLHHVVLGKPPEGLVTDHINRNKLDNRKNNLRFVTQRENLGNGAHSKFQAA